MGTGTIVAIVVGAVVVIAILYFVLKGKSAQLLEGQEAEPRPEPEARATGATPPKPQDDEVETPEKAPATTKAAEPAKAKAKAAALTEPEPEPEPAEEPDEGDEADEEARTEEAAVEEEEEVEVEERVAAAPSAAKRAPSEEDVKALKKGLASTRGGFIARLAKLFGKKKEIDPELLDEIQEVLITADIGVKTTEKILARLRERMENDELSDEDRVWEALREDARTILGTPQQALDLSRSPSLILVVGVNGVGKTTTIGKLASRYGDEGKKVILAAGDTFRAAAVLQLEVWGRRVGCEVVKGKDRADPASVVFDAIKKAESEGAHVVIADTAGRLHTKANLMEELKKVVRTAEKALGRKVDEILLVLDSTTGQNAIQQAQLFKDAIEVSGIALTKLDGTAKGGVILGIVDEHALPVHFIGIGERVEDLREFDAEAFVAALFAKPDDDTIAA